MAILTGLVAFVAYAVSVSLGYGTNGVGIGLLLAGLLNFVSYYFSDSIVLAQSGAKKIDRQDAPEYYSVVERLCNRADLPIPRLYVIHDQSMNAFATGRDHTHASVAVTAGLLRHLNSEELEGVIAHELAHIKNFDIRLMSLVSVLVGFLSILSNVFWRSNLYGHSSDRESNRGGNIFSILLLLITPLVGMLIQFAISRQREFIADATGARIVGSARGLMHALLKLERGADVPLATADISTSHLYINNPFGAGSVFQTLFSTHPPMAERIQELQKLKM